MRKQTDPKPEKTIDQMVSEYNAAAMVVPPEISIPTTPQEAEDMLQSLHWKALGRLNAILDNPLAKDSDIIKAAANVADRLLGKPAQTQTLDMHMKAELVSISLTDQEILKKYLEQPK